MHQQSFEELQGSDYKSFLLMVQIINKTFASSQRYEYVFLIPLYAILPKHKLANVTCRFCSQVCEYSSYILCMSSGALSSPDHNLKHSHAMW